MRRRKRYADAVEGLTKAHQDLDAAAAAVVIWAGKLGDARARVAYYLKRISDTGGEGARASRVIVSRAVPELVDRLKLGAIELLDGAGYEAPPPEGGAPRAKAKGQPCAVCGRPTQATHPGGGFVCMDCRASG